MGLGDILTGNRSVSTPIVFLNSKLHIKCIPPFALSMLSPYCFKIFPSNVHLNRGIHVMSVVN
jgi:hypothetical protein